LRHRRNPADNAAREPPRRLSRLKLRSVEPNNMS
jgi:hypothetical protein